MNAIAVALLATSVAIGAAQAQSTVPLPDSHAAMAKEAITLALFDSFSTPHLNAVVRRSKGQDGKVLIAIKRSALSVELLNAVLTAVPATAGRKRQESARADIYFRDDQKLRPVGAVDRRDLAKTMSELLRARAEDVPGFGKHAQVALSR